MLSFDYRPTKVADYFVVVFPAFLVLVLSLWFYTGSHGSDDLGYADLAYSMLDPTQANGPAGHHAGRVGMTIPLAGVFALFGVNDYSLSLLSMLSTVVTAGLLAKLTQRSFGNMAAIIAGCLYAFFPPTINLASDFIPEPLLNLELTLASVLFLGTLGQETGAGIKNYLAGLLIGAAYLTTEVGALMVGVFAIYLLVSRQFRPVHLWVLAGFLTVFCAELLGHAIIHGNAFYRYSLGAKYMEDPMLVSANADLAYRLFKSYPSYFVYPNWEFGISGPLLLIAGVYGVVKFRTCSFFVIWAAVIFVFYNFISVSMSHYVVLPAASRLINPGCLPLLVLAGVALSDLWQTLNRRAGPQIKTLSMAVIVTLLGGQILVSLLCMSLLDKRGGFTGLLARNVEMASVRLQNIPALTLISDGQSARLFKYYRQYRPQDSYIDMKSAVDALGQNSKIDQQKPIFALLNMPLLYEKNLTGGLYGGGLSLNNDAIALTQWIVDHCGLIFSANVDTGQSIFEKKFGHARIEKLLNIKNHGNNENDTLTKVKVFQCGDPARANDARPNDATQIIQR